MAENVSRRSLHFQCPDPLSREATSRTTRYRVKKRRAEEANVTDLSTPATQQSDSEDVEEQSVDYFDDFSAEMPSASFPEEFEIQELHSSEEDEDISDHTNVRTERIRTDVVSPCCLV